MLKHQYNIGIIILKTSCDNYGTRLSEFIIAFPHDDD